MCVCVYVCVRVLVSRAKEKDHRYPRAFEASAPTCSAFGKSLLDCGQQPTVGRRSSSSSDKTGDAEMFCLCLSARRKGGSWGTQRACSCIVRDYRTSVTCVRAQVWCAESKQAREQAKEETFVFCLVKSHKDHGGFACLPPPSSLFPTGMTSPTDGKCNRRCIGGRHVQHRCYCC
jgi:hypothetical protein